MAHAHSVVLHAALCALFIGTAAAQPRNVTGERTSYGWPDNCPPGADISYPVVHKVAGGVGSFADPVTYAGVTAATPKGTIIYIWGLRKYFVMEDDCEECSNDWKRGQKWHVDLWMGPSDHFPNATAVIACENAITKSKDSWLVDAPAGLPVDLTPLYDAATNKCIVPSSPCHDVGNECGNSCEIPDRATCAQLEVMFSLTDTRFKQLNPNLDCSKPVPAGTDVCQGGSCGD